MSPNDIGTTAFDRIVLKLTTAENDVTAGKIMSAPGLKCGDKIFAFRSKQGMEFRIGREFDLNAHGSIELEPLNPFKTKGPLKGWYIVADKQRDAWEALARSALAFTRTL